MRRLIIGTSILLLVQLALVVAGHLGSRNTMSATPESPFLAMTGEGVTGLEIEGGSGETLRLEKKDGIWTLPDQSGAPADNRQVAALLDKLAALKQGFVVASSAEAAKRFKVADDNFERRLVVREDGKVTAEFLAGTSPAFRQVHARRIGSSDIVAVNLSSYDLETSADTWLDKQVLQVADTNLAGIDIAGLSVKRHKQEGKEKAVWQLADGGGDTVLDVKAAEELAEAVSRLIVLGVVEAKDHDKLTLERPALAFTVHTVDNKDLQFAFAAIDDNFFAVKRSDSELVYTTSKAEVETLQRFTRDTLLGIQPAPGAPGAPEEAAGSLPADGTAPVAPAPGDIVPGT